MAQVLFNCCFVFALLAGAWASADVRLVDAAGGVSSVGLLEVNTDAGFGSVCGANAAAADATRPRASCYVRWASCGGGDLQSFLLLLSVFVLCCFVLVWFLVKVICRSMGYARGSVSSSPCGFYGGADLCGAPGSPVACSLRTFSERGFLYRPLVQGHGGFAVLRL
jgi:hypothetical protein